jgi:hypothetical protein
MKGAFHPAGKSERRFPFDRQREQPRAEVPSDYLLQRRGLAPKHCKKPRLSKNSGEFAKARMRQPAP